MTNREQIIKQYQAAAYTLSMLVLTAEKEIILNITDTDEYKDLVKSFDGMEALEIKVADLRIKL